MGLFSASQLDKINAIAARSNEAIKPVQAVNTKSVNDDLIEISNKVKDYFKDSPAILIDSKEQLHEYVDKCIEAGYAGIDTETTGLDRLNDTIVGFSLYAPGEPECYIPNKHKVPIFDTFYKNQLSYSDCGEEIQRLVDAKVKLILANADFDIAMIHKDYGVDIVPAVYYDVILAWRCIKEDEKDNTLKGLYAKYVKHGQVDPMKFSDFFPVKLFPYCKPEVAKLYAANDAVITYELFLWQLPYVTKSNPKCQEKHLEKIADLVWNIEFPMMSACANLHSVGMFLDQSIAPVLHDRYYSHQQKDEAELATLVQELIDTKDIASNRKRPFRTGQDFNPNSPIHVKYLVNNLLGIDAKSTGKEVLKEINKPVTQKVLDVRGDIKLLGTYVDKLPRITGPTGRVHATFKSIGADTGRTASADPNMQNIPSKATDIRHLFRATPGKVLIGADFSQQEPKLLAYVSQEPTMLKTFMEGRDIYATLASVAYKVPYEECLEFHPETHEYQPEGKKRRGTGKVLNLGINYGMSVASIGESLFAGDDTITDEQKTKRAQEIYDAVMLGFPHLRDFILASQQFAAKNGYTETILGRRRHHPDMMLPRFEFKPMPGYMNPDIDPLDPTTLENKDAIPERVIKKLTKEFNNLKYYGQIVKRTKQLAEEKIAVINNSRKIDDASRQIVNSIIQGSAADLTKMAILRLINNPEWKAIGGKLVNCIHDELLCEVDIKDIEKGSQLLQDAMVGAGDFLPFKLTCDVERSFRWYGLAYDDIMSYDKPESLDYDSMTESNICWLQCMLCENEYLLPVYKEADGSKPKGIKSHGVNGVVSDEMKSFIQDYKKRYGLQDDQSFLDHIEKKVIEGVY